MRFFQSVERLCADLNVHLSGEFSFLRGCVCTSHANAVVLVQHSAEYVASLQGHVEGIFRFVTFYVFYAIVIVQLILTFFSDTLPTPRITCGKVATE